MFRAEGPDATGDSNVGLRFFTIPEKRFGRAPMVGGSRGKGRSWNGAVLLGACVLNPLPSRGGVPGPVDSVLAICRLSCTRVPLAFLSSGTYDNVRASSADPNWYGRFMNLES